MADLAIEPMKIVGYEGVIGAATMLAVMLPAVYYAPGVEGQGLHEDVLDTLHMIRSSGRLQVRRAGGRRTLQHLRAPAGVARAPRRCSRGTPARRPASSPALRRPARRRCCWWTCLRC